VVSQPLTVRIAFAICLLLFLASAVACDPGHSVTYVNNTPYRLRIYDAKDRLVAELEPFEMNTGSELEHLWTGRRVAKTQDGRVVFQADLTWEELKAQDWRIVVTEDMLSPTPTEAR
jgi:hypothetical protein